MTDNSHFYSAYCIVDTVCHDDVIERFVQYRMMAKNLLNGEPVPYLLDFMKWKNLWITDIYPEIWADDENRCRRFTSHEGIRIDFRKISNTSVFAFLKDFQENDGVMVISGSYQDEENRRADSRKLRLYRYFFNELKGRLDFDIVESEGMNAFFIFKAGSSISHDIIKAQYETFRHGRDKN